MKKFRLLMFGLFTALAFAFAACDKTGAETDPNPEPGPGPDPEPETELFEFAVSEITGGSATVEVTPSDASSFYYFDVVATSELRGYGNAEQAAQAFLDELAEYVEYGILTWNDLLSKGSDVFDYECTLEPETAYTVFAVYVDYNGSSVSISSEASTGAFTTTATGTSNNTFFISEEKGNITVVPSLTSEWYVWDFGETSWYEDTDAQVIADEIEMLREYGLLSQFLCRGVDSYNYASYCTEGESYTVIAFGFDGGATTPLTRYEFVYSTTTPGPDPGPGPDPDVDVTFNIDINVSGNDAAVTVTPSDNTVYYYFDIGDGGDVTADADGYFQAMLDEIYEDYVKPGRYTWNQILSQGPDYYTFSDLPSNYPMAIIAGVVVDGKLSGKATYKEFTINSGSQGGGDTSELTFEIEYDGTSVFSVYPSNNTDTYTMQLYAQSLPYDQYPDSAIAGTLLSKVEADDIYTGAVKLNYSGITPGMTLTAIVFGYANGQMTTATTRLFATGGTPGYTDGSGNGGGGGGNQGGGDDATFDVSHSGDAVSVSTDFNGPYVLSVWTSSSISGYDDGPLMNAVLYTLSNNNVLEDSIYSGNVTVRYEGLTPGASYTALVFGYNNGDITTGLTRYEFTYDGDDTSDLPEGFKIDVQVTNITATTATVTSTASHNNVPFYAGITAADFLDDYDTEAEAIADLLLMMKELYEYYGMSWSSMLTTGVDVYDWDELDPDYEWIAYAAASDANGNMLGEPTVVKWKTLPEGGGSDSGVTFELVVTNVSHEGATVLVTPSDNSVKYYCGAFSAEEVGSDPQAFFADEIAWYRNLINSGMGYTWNSLLSSGPTTRNFNWCDPNVTYYVLVGVVDEDGYPASEVATATFYTVDKENVTFSFTPLEITEDYANIKITASDASAPFYFRVSDMGTVNAMGGIEEYYAAMVAAADQTLKSRGQSWASVLEKGSAETDTWDLMPGTQHVVIASVIRDGAITSDLGVYEFTTEGGGGSSDNFTITAVWDGSGIIVQPSDENAPYVLIAFTDHYTVEEYPDSTVAYSLLTYAVQEQTYTGSKRFTLSGFADGDYTVFIFGFDGSYFTSNIARLLITLGNGSGGGTDDGGGSFPSGYQAYSTISGDVNITPSQVDFIGVEDYDDYYEIGTRNWYLEVDLKNGYFLAVDMFSAMSATTPYGTYTVDRTLSGKAGTYLAGYLTSSSGVGGSLYGLIENDYIVDFATIYTGTVTIGTSSTTIDLADVYGNKITYTHNGSIDIYSTSAAGATRASAMTRRTLRQFSTAASMKSSNRVVISKFITDRLQPRANKSETHYGLNLGKGVKAPLVHYKKFEIDPSFSSFLRSNDFSSFANRSASAKANFKPMRKPATKKMATAAVSQLNTKGGAITRAQMSSFLGMNCLTPVNIETADRFGSVRTARINAAAHRKNETANRLSSMPEERRAMIRSSVLNMPAVKAKMRRVE